MLQCSMTDGGTTEIRADHITFVLSAMVRPGTTRTAGDLPPMSAVTRTPFP